MSEEGGPNVKRCKSTYERYRDITNALFRVNQGQCLDHTNDGQDFITQQIWHFHQFLKDDFPFSPYPEYLGLPIFRDALPKR